jgi:alpha-tubulin suppressor-like RCC1 family protein
MTTEGGVQFRRVAVSLSPMKYRPSKENTKRSNNLNTTTAQVPHCSLAINDTETILVSASGDVLVCRCRESSSPYLRGDVVSRRTKANLRQWWEPDCDALTNHLGDVVLASPCCGNQRPSTAHPMKPGLRGGSRTVVGSVTKDDNNTRKLLGDASLRNSSESLEEKKCDGDHFDDEILNKERMGMMVPSLLDGENEALFPLPSFDYSHFADGGNDMIPSSQQRLDALRKMNRLEAVPENRSILADTSKNPSRDYYHHHPDLESVGSPIHSDAAVEAWHESLYTPGFFHGVPVFHPAFSQIRITQVSANPFGSHVLLISREALLFAYGLNNHGQLGNGQRAKVNGNDRGFITTPILVTPLLENGGKAITCAAGKNHSLVVVRTEGRRVGRSRQMGSNGAKNSSDAAYEMSRRASSGSRLRIYPTNASENENDSLLHHQLYGFGSNKYMKLGLLNPGRKSENDQEDVLLPRRVALHCNVWPDTPDGGALPSFGIFDIAASCDHSAALVRRATGDIELYTWGNGTYGALGLAGSQMQFSSECLEEKGHSRKGHSRSEAIEKKASNDLMNGTRGKAEVMTHSKAVAPIPTLVTSLPYYPGTESAPINLHPSEFPTSVALGNTSSYVVTSRGRCLSFGSSEAGMLGLGPGVTKSLEAMAVSFPAGSSRSGRMACIKSVSVGARHVVAHSTEGSAFTWGNTCFRDTEDRSDYGAIAWQPERVQIPLKESSSKPNLLPTPENKSRGKVARICAGLDTTVLVTDSGEVHSYGRMSGQLGLGELQSDVLIPTPMLGGLHLWHSQEKSVQRHVVKKINESGLVGESSNLQQ